jgi:small subunit ribosomal protein S21
LAQLHPKKVLPRVLGLLPAGYRAAFLRLWIFMKPLALGGPVCHMPHSAVANPSEAIQCKPLEVAVGDKGIERAIKHLKRKMAAEGILRELKRRRHYMKPSVKRRKKMSEAARRRRKREKTVQF